MNRRGASADRLTWTLVTVVGAAGLLLSFVGNMLEYPPATGGRAGASLPVLAGALDNLWRSTAAFVLEGDIRPGQNWWLVLGRVVSPLATLGGLYRLSADLVAARLAVRHIARLRNHLLILGGGTRGQLVASRATGPVVLVDLAPPPARSAADGQPVHTVAGDARRPDVLASAGIGRAKRVLILTGDDATNLQILDRVLEARTSPVDDLVVSVRLDNRKLARQLDREDAFVRRAFGRPSVGGEDDARLEVEAFDEDRAAARLMLRDHPLVDLADLSGQPRVHVVVVGWTGFAFEVIEQVARLSPYRSFDAPRVDLFVQDVDAVRGELSGVQPALVVGAPAAALAGPGLRPHPPVLDLRVHRLPPGGGLPTPEQMRMVEPDGLPSLTAIVVTLDSDDASAAAALGLRDRSSSEGRWQCPIFVKIALAGTLTNLIAGLADRLEQADRVVPVGTLASIYHPDGLWGGRDVAARRLHEAYRADRRDAGTATGTPPDVPWRRLPVTYRLANRRAVDHLPIKLRSAGFRVTGFPLSAAPAAGALFDPETVEALAALEHRSWEIDRLLDGWRGGAVRDDRRRIHDAIGLDYAQLDEVLGRPMREFDRAQVRVAGRMLTDEPGEVTVWRELTVGLLGDGTVPDALRGAWLAAVDRSIDALLAAHPGRSIALVTTLVPGVELMLAERVRERLVDAGIVHRLVVVRSLPVEAVVADVLPDLCAGGVWTLAAPDAPDAGDAQGLPRRVQARLDAYVRGARDVDVADLRLTGSSLGDCGSADYRADAWRRAGAYLGGRADVAIVCAPTGGGARARITGELLAWMRGEAGPPPVRLLPAGLARPVAPRLVMLDPLIGGAQTPPELVR